MKFYKCVQMRATSVYVKCMMSIQFYLIKNNVFEIGLLNSEYTTQQADQQTDPQKDPLTDIQTHRSTTQYQQNQESDGGPQDRAGSLH